MTQTARHRVLPWALFGLLLGLLAVTLLFTALNDSFEAFVYIAIVMMIGYGTVGAVLASRGGGGVLGWLMLLIALGFVATAISDELVTYRYVTNPTSELPLGSIAAWLTNWLFVVVFTPLILIPLLFPTGRVLSPSWRWVPRAVVGVAALGSLATMLRPGFVETEDARVLNPTGIEGLEEPLAMLLFVLGVCLLLLSVVSVVSLFLRFRRAGGDERQQIRWVAYLAVLAIVLLAIAIAAGIVTGDSGPSYVLFLALFTVVGIALPLAIGLAVLKYRLYDLDLVVKKTVLYSLVALVLVGLFVVAAILLGSAFIDAHPIAIVAAIAIGLASWPAVRMARRVADRIVYGRRATPYEVLSEFSHRVGGSYSAEDVLPRMAEILAGAVGANEAVIWLRVGGELRAAGRWPAEAAVPSPLAMSGDVSPSVPGDAAVEVRDRGDVLGALAVSMPANDPMNPGRERLVRDLASQAGLVLRNVRLIEEVRASRQRLVAAQDQERRRLERNIHDGAQQQLVALTVKLRLLEQTAGRDPVKAAEIAAQLQVETTSALADLRDLARGIYPPLLADEGLPAALSAQARKAQLPVRVDADGIGRFSEDVEAAVYFSCLEALQNVAKYAGASAVTISLVTDDGRLLFSVNDDGVGFDPATATRGTGLQGIADRLDALGGRLDVTSRIGTGTTVAGSVPVD